jgi:hypothetical protein
MDERLTNKSCHGSSRGPGVIQVLVEVIRSTWTVYVVAGERYPTSSVDKRSHSCSSKKCEVELFITIAAEQTVRRNHW